MKYIVIGLGYFGSTLASNLTSQGHEVIGVDNQYEKIEEYKDSISVVMEMEATSPQALKSLPLHDVNAVIVAIGEDIGSSVLILSLLQNSKVKRIIGRAITPIHRNILHQLGIKEIIQPEEKTALMVSSILQIKYAQNVLELNHENAVAELLVPEKYVGHSADSVNIFTRFKLKLIAVKIPSGKNEIFSQHDENYTIEYNIEIDRLLKENDILVVVGNIDDIKRFTES
ncbi:MAG: TrkA family potassium uptake protein [Paludibacteraceae bacterium]|nr:TrkA family potassium uptake protein [Prolixibacteraceae bacterium]MBN2787364.1 TrkA family potassium uptake protein [Paludibacteraceae bacterium]